MAKDGIVLNHATIARILRRNFAGQVNSLARKIADKANEAAPGSAFVEPYTTDRSAAAVIVRTELQVRDGALTKAAGRLGLKIQSKGAKP